MQTADSTQVNSTEPQCCLFLHKVLGTQHRITLMV